MKLAIFLDCQIDLDGQPSVDVSLLEVLADPTPSRIGDRYRTLDATAKRNKRRISIECVEVDTDEAIR